MYFGVVCTEYCSADHAEVVDAGGSISRPSAHMRAKCKVVRWSEVHFTKFALARRNLTKCQLNQSSGEVYHPRYFKKCHIKERCTLVLHAQSIVLPAMPKWLMRAGLYLDIQPASEQNAKSSNGAKHIFTKFALARRNLTKC